MTTAEYFIEWAESLGCEVEITQEDGGNGYTVMQLTTPKLDLFDITVMEPTE